MVANISVLKAVFAYILESVDHRNLDVDVPFFKSHVSTTENLCIYFWNEASDYLSREVPERTFNLYEVKIHETEKNSAFYRGSEN